MGYYVVITEAEFFIETDKLDLTLTTLIEFFNQHKDYYEYYHNELENISHCSELFNLLGFDCDLNNDGLSILSFDAKYADQDNIISSIAHLVNAGSYMLWRGEDDLEWGWLFDGTQLLDLSIDNCMNQMYTIKENIQLVKTLNENLPINTLVQNNKQKL